MQWMFFLSFDSFDQVVIKKLHLNFWKHVWGCFLLVSLTLIKNFQSLVLKRQTFPNDCSEIKFFYDEFIILLKSFFEKSDKSNLIFIEEILFFKGFVFVDWWRFNFASDDHSLKDYVNFVVKILCVVEGFVFIKYDFFHDNKKPKDFINFTSLNIFLSVKKKDF